MTTELVVIFLLLIANGVFAMAEIALVSSGKSRLRYLAEGGEARARVALELAESPSRFLATIQVGITMVGIFAGALGGARLADTVGAAIGRIELLSPYAPALGFAVVVVTITYFSLVIGELVPKRLALSNPEQIAMRLAWPMTRMAALARPVVGFLSLSTEGVLRLFGFRGAERARVSEDEVKMLMREGLRAGVFLPSESAMVESVLALDRLAVRDLMTPRAKIIWANVTDSHDAIWHKIVVSGHSNFPVYEGNRDNIVGIVSVKSIYANLAAGVPVNVKDLMITPLVVPTSQTAAALLETFRKTGKHIALVADEFGAVAGLVTLHDVMEAVLGDFPSQDERLKPTARQRPDGSWLVDAMIETEEFEKLVPQFKLDPRGARDYQTFGGFVVKRLGQVPSEGDSFCFRGFEVEVIDMDRHRVDKVLLIPIKPETPAETPAEAPPPSPEI